ncbi:electron transporter SenC [Polymorphobacter multimanifer]|uniref:Protein SCO1/2 n=1 Tax=Polymorphobacter multimanifer TaxID=1070431 RepID=A0A841LGP8_9SPHN|nr:SCO family protein [Polymorphobacter multimanifer]MBB6228148.1 protein SCO1/2 [Polymorphobacter multimanifer]GGI80822.1 electron transporter SenC [Polymorphobacter multimanifer]
MNSILKRARIVALVLAVALAGWIGWQQFGSQSSPQGNLVGSSLGGAFQLVDQDGQPRSDADFRGQWRLMYFGYTFCPDVCPTDMAVIGRALQQFEASDPARGAKVTPIFTTVDPARDTPEAIKPFVKAFHPRFIGLTGSEPAVAAAMKTFGIYAKKAETRDPENYLVDHFAVFYLFDPEGRPVAFLPHGSEAAELTAMLNTHVR